MADGKLLILNSGGAPTESIYAKTCAELGCVAADPDDAGTYTEEVGQENAEKIQDHLDTWETDHWRKILFNDADYVLADHDDDTFQIDYPPIHGGEIHCLGGAAMNDFFVPAHGHGMTAARFISVGASDEVMLNYKGRGGHFFLNMLGAIANNSSQALAIMESGEHAKALVANQNATPESNLTPNGSKSNYWLHGALANYGMWFPSGGSFGDTVRSHDLFFTFVNKHYFCQELQAVAHMVDRINHDGWQNDVMFEFERGGDLLVGWAYIPNGVLLRIGSNVASGNFVFQDVKLDQNYVGDSGEGTLYANWAAGECPLVDCYTLNSEIRVRIGGHYGLFSLPCTWQSVKRKQTLSILQPDIVLDIKGMPDAERAAFSRLRERGYGWNPEEKFPVELDSSCKLWLEAPEGLADGATITSITDESASSNDVAGGVSPVFSRYGINWEPTVDCYPSASGKYLVNATPDYLDDSLGDFTIFAVFLPTNVSNIQSLLSCTNSNGNGGFVVYLWSDAKMVLGMSSSNGGFSEVTLEENRPTLAVISRQSSSGTVKMRILGQLSEGTGQTGTLPTVTGSLVVGARQNSGPIQQQFRGSFSHLSLFNAYVDLGDPEEAPQTWHPSNWDAWAYAVWQNLVARFGVW